MKIAAVSDIHSNVYALEAVTADAKKRSVDLLLNLGDILYGPIAPRATYDLLMESEFITICGNQDRQIFEATARETEDNPTMQFILEDLGQEPLLWMKSLPFDCRVSDEIYLCHGTPKSDLIYLLEDVDTGEAKVRSDRDILNLLAGEKSDVIICGHTHTPRTVKLTSDQLVINPGSVGLPAYTDEEPILHSMATFSAHASYAILEKAKYGWIVEHIKVPYDHNKAAQEALKRGRKDWVHYLTTGRGL